MDKAKCKHCKIDISKGEGELVWKDANPLTFLSTMCLTSPTKHHQPEDKNKDEEMELEYVA